MPDWADVGFASEIGTTLEAGVELGAISGQSGKIGAPRTQLPGAWIAEAFPCKQALGPVTSKEVVTQN
jgi:hypothetical protein